MLSSALGTTHHVLPIGKAEIWHWKIHEVEEALTAAVGDLSPTEGHLLHHICKTGVWLSISLSMVNGMELGSHEWRDSVFLQCGIENPDLLRHCNVCGFGFMISHALYFKKGGLVMYRYNELSDGVANLDIKALTPTHMVTPCGSKRPLWISQNLPTTIQGWR